MSKEKIVVLGTGVAAMTSVCYLTDQPGWQDKYDITVYQLGWRAGGKGASGRNREYGQRIEEHGLHVWFGAYVNSFRMIESVYDQLKRDKHEPLATWQDAFKPHSYIVLQEHIDNDWIPWHIDFPEIPGNPAHGTLDLHFWEMLRLMYHWVKKFIDDIKALKETLSAPDKDDDGSWIDHLRTIVKREWHEFKDDVEDITTLLGDFFDDAMDLDDSDDEKHQSSVFGILNRLRNWLHKEYDEMLEEHNGVRRLYIGIDLGLTVMIGMLADNVYKRGFGYINQWDYKQWLIKHGANVKYSVNSAPVRGFYDLVFAYKDGDFADAELEAGVALLAQMRMVLCYKGGFMWKMQAGMGDTIFSPIHQLLKRRGVKFAFFHKVEQLHPDACGKEIQTIELTRQVSLKNNDPYSYDPFVYVKGLACWPSIPNYDQIDEQQATWLKDHNINLESFWSDWPQLYQQNSGEPLPEITLQKGKDFDKVIFGIAIGALPHICKELLAQDAKLRLSSENVKTVATQAYQLWMDIPFDQLGWQACPTTDEEPILTAFTDPFDTWAAMNQLLLTEDWPQGIDPKNVAYFCSAQSIDEYPPASDSDFPARCYLNAKQNAIRQLQYQIHHLWPNTGSTGEFDWSTLTDPHNQVGVARFDSQYWRSNVDPSERYVLSVTGSSQYRLSTDGTRYHNLYITGDWIDTGVNAGCVEAAVMAGMATSRAICGHPQQISGEDGFKPKGAW